VIKNPILLASLISLFSFCFSFLSFDFVEASFIDNIEIEGPPVKEIKYNSDNKYLYLSQDDNSVVIVDTMSNKIINRITTVGKNPTGIDYNPDNKLMYVTNRDDNSVSVINYSSNLVIKNITGVGKQSNGIIYNPDNNLIYVTNFYEGSISVINSSFNTVIKNITDVGKNPSDIAYNTNNKLLYIINKDRAFDHVTIIDPMNGDIIEKVVIGNDARHILYNPSNHKMYITKNSSPGMLVMNTSKDG